jgi:hypothetical protein
MAIVDEYERLKKNFWYLIFFRNEDNLSQDIGTCIAKKCFSN